MDLFNNLLFDGCTAGLPALASAGALCIIFNKTLVSRDVVIVGCVRFEISS